MMNLRFKKNLLPILMNFIGLGIAFTVFLVLMSQVWWDFRYDRFKGSKDVYVVEGPSFRDGFYSPAILRPVIQMIEDCSPGIAVACDYYSHGKDELGAIRIRNRFGEYEDARGIKYAMTETSVLDVFNITLLSGRREDFAKEGDALVSESTAALYFPDRDPVGETFTYEGEDCRIAGVYKDRKENESLINGILIHEGDTDLSLPNRNMHACYVKLSKDADLAEVREAVGNVRLEPLTHDLRLTQIHDSWFEKDKDTWGKKIGGNSLLCIVLLSIAILFLAIAAFNYINFAMASIPFRIKDINTRKVYGASRGSLIARQLAQAAIIVGAAFAAAVLAMKTLSGTSWASFLSGSMMPSDNKTVLGICGVAAVLIAIVSGFIPAIYSTSFQPALVLKGSFSMTARGGGLRNITIALQYVLSFIFILSALVLQRQTSFMVRNNQLGFDYDLVLKMESRLFSQVADVASRLKDIPGVTDVTRGESPIQEGFSSMSEIRQGEDLIKYSFRTIPPEYPGFFGLELVEGRLPLPGENDVALVNESFHQAVPSVGIGQEIYLFSGKHTVIGILKDFHSRSLEHAFSPLVLFVKDKVNFASFMLRVDRNADVPSVLGQARSIYHEMKHINEDDIETGFLDKDIEKLYEQEIRQTRLIKLSSLLSLVITLIGILGLVWFDTRFMRKEIAIRKVNGASTKDILRKINLKYMIIATIGFAIAAPLAVAICRRWMQHFAFRTGISPLLFIVAYAAVILITLGVVSLQCLKAASANPVDSLKNE